MAHIANYRYFLDMRIGCCGIVDTTLPHSDNLSENNPNVVMFWMGKFDEESRCWYVPMEIEVRANKICILLNEMDKFQNGTNG